MIMYKNIAQMRENSGKMMIQTNINDLACSARSFIFVQ